jgi:hypothetical protein
VHLAVLYWPLLVLTVVYAHALFRGRRRWLWGFCAIALIPAIVVVGDSGRLVWKFRALHDTPLADRRAPHGAS